MRKVNLVLLAMVAATAFLAGQWYQQKKYQDVCLDLGGGQNPGNHPICVVERPSSD